MIWTHPTMNAPLSPPCRSPSSMPSFWPVAVYVCIASAPATTIITFCSSASVFSVTVTLLVTIVLDPPCTYAQDHCCKSCDSVFVHRACCPSVTESQPHPTLYIKLYYIQQHSTKTQNRIWVSIFESYLAACLSL